MNRADIIRTMADSAGISKAAAEKALAGALDAMAEALAAGEKLSPARGVTTARAETPRK